MVLEGGRQREGGGVKTGCCEFTGSLPPSQGVSSLLSLPLGLR